MDRNNPGIRAIDHQLPAEFDAINSKLKENELRMAALEQAMKINTAMTAETAEVTRDIRDALIFARVSTRIIKWLGAFGAVVVTALTIWTSWRKP